MASYNTPVDLEEFTSQRGFVYQPFWQLTAVFFSGVVAYRLHVGLNVCGVRTSDDLGNKKLNI